VSKAPVRLSRRTVYSSLIIVTLLAGGGYYAYQEYEARNRQKVLEALIQDCNACAERKAARLRSKDWPAKQRAKDALETPKLAP